MVNKRVALSLTLLISVSSIWFFLHKLNSQKHIETHVEGKTRKFIYSYDLSQCPGPTVKFVVNDVYMKGMLEKDSEVQVSLNSFSCQDPKRDQIVLYRFSEFEDPVLRRVVALPKDTFDLKKHNGHWVLIVNGKYVNDFHGSQYFFGSNDLPPLGLAAKAKKNILGENEYIIFSAFPPGDKDSGVFGLVSKTDLVGSLIK